MPEQTTVYKFVRPKYIAERACPLYILAEMSNELSTTLEEEDIMFMIGGSSALGTAIPVTSDYMRRRTSCDLDIFVELGDFGKFDEVARRAGWQKYEPSECGMIRTYSVCGEEKTLIGEFPNIENFVAYHKPLPNGVNFLIYLSNIGDYTRRYAKGDSIVEQKGHNRSPEESFVHKVFRYSRRDRSDFLAVAETDGLAGVLGDGYAKQTFLGYLSDEGNVKKLGKYVQRMKAIRDKYDGAFRTAGGMAKKLKKDLTSGVPERRLQKHAKMTLHRQTKKIPLDSDDFKKIMFGLSEKIYWLGDSIETLEGFTRNGDDLQ